MDAEQWPLGIVRRHGLVRQRWGASLSPADKTDDGAARVIWPHGDKEDTRGLLYPHL